MDSGPQEADEPSDYLSFSSGNNDDNRGYRNNFQYRPYNRNRNYRNQNFRRNQPFGGRNEGDSHFAPMNFSSPHQQQPDNWYRNRPNHNNFQNRRNFTPFNKFGGHNYHNKEAPIQDYFHKSMIEDPWVDCHKYRNGADAPESDPTDGTTNEPTES